MAPRIDGEIKDYPALPIVIVIVTKDEKPAQLRGCLDSIGDFAPVLIVETTGPDGQIPPSFTQIAADYPVKMMPYQWNGQYPKKRQYVLDHWDDIQAISTDFADKNWVFFIDADERLTPAIKAHIQKLFKSTALHPNKVSGYFIQSIYRIHGHDCRFGMRNHKLALFDRRLWAFPLVDDLDCPGMGEIEGHYQPIYIGQIYDARRTHVGYIRTPMIHLALNNDDDHQSWRARHDRYAQWAAYVMEKEKKRGRGHPILPHDPGPLRRIFKAILSIMPPVLRPYAAFCHSFFIKLGCLDGRAGMILATSRYDYYRRLNHYLKAIKMI